MSTAGITAYRLLALSARAQCRPVHHRRIAEAAAEIEAWDEVLSQAEYHGVSPLLYVHLRTAGAPIPELAERRLRASYMRHCLASQTWTGVLGDVLEALQADGIQPLVLKGAALSHSVYPDPGLRPMHDVDLLVSRSQAQRAQRVLAGAGFDAPPPSRGESVHRHLPPATARVDGQQVCVEIHQNLSGKVFPFCAREIQDLVGPPISFSLGPGGPVAHTLGYNDMIWHLCQHTVEDTCLGAHRLIGVADIVSFAERFAAEIDWPSIEARCPLVLNMLSLLHPVTLLSDELLGRAPIPGGPVPQSEAEEFRAWLVCQRQKTLGQVRHDVAFPSRWWVRLYYGPRTRRGVFWTRWVRHPLHMLRLVAHRVRERLRALVSE